MVATLFYEHEKYLVQEVGQKWQIMFERDRTNKNVKPLVGTTNEKNQEDKANDWKMS